MDFFEFEGAQCRLLLPTKSQKETNHSLCIGNEPSYATLLIRYVGVIQVILHDWTPFFNWCMDWEGSKNKNHKVSCLKETRSHCYSIYYHRLIYGSPQNNLFFWRILPHVVSVLVDTMLNPTWNLGFGTKGEPTLRYILHTRYYTPFGDLCIPLNMHFWWS